jgi:hypothetical protein
MLLEPRTERGDDVLIGLLRLSDHHSPSLGPRKLCPRRGDHTVALCHRRDRSRRPESPCSGWLHFVILERVLRRRCFGHQSGWECGLTDDRHVGRRPRVVVTGCESVGLGVVSVSVIHPEGGRAVVLVDGCCPRRGGVKTRVGKINVCWWGVLDVVRIGG